MMKHVLRPHHSHSFRATVLLSMVMVLLSACTSWYPMSLEPRALPYRVRITTESERVELKEARLVGDIAVAGSWKGTPRSIRLVDMQLLEGGQIDPVRVILFGVGIPLLFVYTAFLADLGVIQGFWRF